jgi:hypothetical protein
LGRKIRNAPSIKPWNGKSPESRFLRVVLKDDAEKRIHFVTLALIAAWAAARRAIGTRNGEQDRTDLRWRASSFGVYTI